jgi:hypothetical protein
LASPAATGPARQRVGHAAGNIEDDQQIESISTAATERSDATALGTSSTMLTTRVLVVLLPSASVAL